MLGYYLLAILSSVYLMGCNGATLGQACDDTDFCTGTFQVCDPSSATCVCNTGYFESGSNCLAKVDLGEPCSLNAACKGQNTTCSTSGKCVCIDTYYDDTGTSDTGGTCLQKISTGSSCPSNLGPAVPCSDSNARCTSTNTGYKCTCISAYYNKNGVCSLKEQLGASCTLTTDCADGYAECSSQKCTCKSGYFDNTGTSDTGGTCVAKIQLGAQCPEPTNAVPNTASCLDNIATCISDGSNYKCLCPSDYYDSNGVNTVGGECLLKKQLGDNCVYNRACSDSNAGCSSGTCVCKSGYYDNNGGLNIGGTCIGKVALGAVCPNPSTGVSITEPCNDVYSTCQNDGNGFKCRCTSNYYDDNGNNNIGGQCVIKVGLGSVCPMADACIKSNSQCVSRTCVCISLYYDTNTKSVLGGDCKIRKSLNTLCTETVWDNYNTDQCSDQFATCISDVCTCYPGYHPEGSSCVANNANGEDCIGDTIDECSDPNSECRNNKCTCKISYYDNNGLAVGGKCQPVTHLQVGSVTFNNIQTTSFNVSWSHPSGTLSQFVDYYTVRWVVINTVDYDHSPPMSSLTSSYTVTNITPGNAYKVVILSRNTQTESNDERIAYVSREQAAKPNKVQKITSSGDDLDVEINGLIIRYTPSTGGKSGFNVKLFDGNTKIAEKDPGLVNTSITMYNSNLPNSYGNLKNGYNYTVNIKTISESYDNGHIVESDVFEAIMKTTPKKPNPPENGQCGNVLDNSITVTWNPPAVPNGYIIRYHVQVYQSSSSLLFTRSTVSDVTSLKVGGLEPGTFYFFKLITENEVGNSIASSRISSGCKTKAKMADPPQSLRISSTSSRGYIVTWDKPVNLYSEENFGYVLQIRDDTDTCVTRVLYRCTDCNLGLFDFSALPNPCTGVIESTELKNKDQLIKPLSYTAVLKPAILYTVTVSAINGAGQGYIAEASKTTLEEAPQKPSLSLVDITSQNVTLVWNIDGPRPGDTFFDIKIVTNQPATSVKETIAGFDKRTFKVTGLEEYWDYNISVIARTSIGSIESNMVSIKTLIAAPGRVSNFVVTKRPGGIYTQIKVTWKAPEPLERNGVIKEYRLLHNTTQNKEWTRDVYRQQESMDYVYDSLLTVVPEMYYLIQVTAVNEDDEIGEVSEVLTHTPAGVPPNNVEQSRDIINYQHDVKETSFSVDLYKEYFQQNEHGMIRATGLIGCITDKCNFNYRMSLSEFNSMTSWTISSQNGYTTYRITKHDWLEDVTRKKRQTSVNIITFAIGVDDCVNIPEDVYCNGPLAPGSSYTIVAVACTNGGCLLSKSYGPFETSKELSCDCDLTAVIVGVVLGVIIVVLLFYSSYVTLRLRRLSKRDQTKQPDVQQQPQYVNQMFLDVVSQSPDVENIPSPEDNYTSLNEETREDKSTYETF